MILSINEACNLRNFPSFAAILKILHPQCVAIPVCTPPESEIRAKSCRRASLSSWGVDAATIKTASSAYNMSSLFVTAADKLLM